MADVTINQDLLRKALTGELKSCYFYEFINNFESYLDLGTLARNYGVEENEIVRIAYDFSILFELDRVDAWSPAATIDRIARRTGVYFNSNVSPYDYRNYHSGRDRNVYPTINIQFKVLNSADISVAINDEEFLSTMVSIIIHEVSHVLDAINMSEAEFKSYEDSAWEQKNKAWQDKLHGNPPAIKYPFFDIEFPQVMHEIHSLENQGMESSEIASYMKEIHKLTSEEADELMERAMTWKEGSYRKLSVEQSVIPFGFDIYHADAKIVKQFMIDYSKEAGGDVHRKQYRYTISELFPKWEDGFDVTRLAHTYTEGNKEVILSRIKDTPINVYLYTGSMWGAPFDRLVGGEAFFKPPYFINLHLRGDYLTQRVSEEETGRQLWRVFCHEFIHVLQGSMLDESGLKDWEVKYKKQIMMGDSYPSVVNEREPIIEEILVKTEQGYTIEEIRQYVQKKWSLNDETTDELMERAMIHVEGSYRKLSDGVPVNLEFLKKSMQISGRYDDVYSKLFSSPEEYFEFDRLDREYLYGTEFSSLDILREVSKNVNLVVYSESNKSVNYPVGGAAGFDWKQGVDYKLIKLQIYLSRVGEYSLNNIARKVWFTFVHEFTHIIDDVGDKNRTQKAGKPPMGRMNEIDEIYESEHWAKVPGAFRELERYPNYEAFRQAEQAGYSRRELYEFGKKLWNLPPRKIDELIERSHTLVEGSYRRLPREQLMFYDSELDFLGNFGETVERKPGAEFETDHGRYRLIEYHPEFPGWYVDCVEWKQGAPVKAGAEMEFPRLINFVRDYILHRSEYAQSGDSNGVTVRYETLFPGYLESEEIQRLIREKLSTDVSGYLEILKHVGSPMGFISVTVRHTSNSPGQIMPFFVNGDVSDSGGMSLVVDVDTEDQGIQVYLSEIATHCWGFFVHEFGHMLDHFNEEDPFSAENAVPKFKKHYYPFQKSEFPQAIAFIRAMEEKGKSREYLKVFCMREWELSEKAFDYLYDQAHKVASYRKFSSVDEFFYLPDDWSMENQSKYSGLKFSDEFELALARVNLAVLKSALDSDAFVVDDMIKLLKSGVKVPPITVTKKNGYYQIEDGNTRVAALKRMGYGYSSVPALIATIKKVSSYRKFSDDELKLKDENVDIGRILILHGEDVLPMAKEALQNHLYVEGWQAKKVFSAILGIVGMDSDYGYLKGSDDIHMAGYYNKADRLVAWAFQYISSPISRYTDRAYRYKGIGTALAVALKEDLGGDLNINERQTPRPEGVLEKKLVQTSYRKISTGKNGDVKPCYLITIPEEAKEFVHTAQESVPKDMLTGQGKPDFPEHVTLLFGVSKDSIEIAKKIINETAPFEIDLKEYGYFDNEDSSVLHVRCESKEMTELHERMKKEIENTHREGSFKAHITVAYLKPDSRADGLPKIPKGMKFRVDAVQLSIPDDEDISKENFTSIGLDGK